MPLAMNTSLEHLPALKRQQLQSVTKIIIHAVRPEKILLFGSYTPEAWESGLYADRQLPLNYDILVITKAGEHRQEHELQDLIENRCRFQTPVTVVVHDIEYVNRQLAAGHYFFTMVSREAILLYDAGSIPLNEACQLNWQAIKAAAELDFAKWHRRASAFFKTALFAVREKELKIAAFLLHQAVENGYQSILVVFTGYKPCTHNLDKLRRYTNRFSIELAQLFPRYSGEDDRLFRLLLQGYIDARYKDDYSIDEEEMGKLIDRAGKLLSIAARMCRNRLRSLDKWTSS